MSSFNNMKLLIERREEYGPVKLDTNKLYRTLSGDLVYSVQAIRSSAHDGKPVKSITNYMKAQAAATGKIDGYMFFVLEGHSNKVPVGAGFETDIDGLAPQDIRLSIAYEEKFILQAQFPQAEHIPEDGDMDYEI